MQVTQELIDDISDEQGLTRGQVYLLTKWGGSDYLGTEIPDVIGNFLKVCKGYREIPQYIKDFKGWT